jgi:membrane dipeptidase
MVGIDHVSIGTDSEATPGAYPREVRRRLGRKLKNTMGGFYERFGNPPGGNKLQGWGGLDDFPRITQGLLARGYDRESIQKVLGLNLVRVFREVWR